MRRTPGRTILDVVVRWPKTMPPEATVAQARAALADDHVHMLLITADGRLVGTVVRSDLPPEVPDDGPAIERASLLGRTVGPDVALEDARELLVSRGQRRLAVVAEDGSLLGLLCLKRKLTGFCSDADVAARAADPSAPRTGGAR